jgi:nucleotide-binding universal stress UspA family protein
MNTMPVKKILMTIDRSGNKEKIIKYAITFAKAVGVDVTAFHVIDRSSLQPAADAYGNYMEGNIEALEEVLKKQAEELLSEAEIMGKEEGINVDKDVVVGSPSAAIIDYARIKNIDLIVIGTKGMIGLKQLLLGSVAKNVISHAHCPVLAIR